MRCRNLVVISAVIFKRRKMRCILIRTNERSNFGSSLLAHCVLNDSYVICDDDDDDYDERAIRCQCLIAIKSEIQPHFMRYSIGTFNRKIFHATPMQRKAPGMND